MNFPLKFVPIFLSILIAAMAGRLKLLQFTQNLYGDMGICIHPSQSNQISFSVNWRYFFVLISMLLMFISSLVFLVFKADTFIDAGMSFYAAVTELSCLFFVYIHLHNMPKILKLIEKYEDFIAESKSFKKDKFGFLLMNKFQIEKLDHF